MSMSWKSSCDESGRVLAGQPCEVGLSLEPSELEALLARMLLCSTRRARSSEPRRSLTPCRKKTGAEWCRLGERAAGGERCVETRFG